MAITVARTRHLQAPVEQVEVIPDSIDSTGATNVSGLIAFWLANYGSDGDTFRMKPGDYWVPQGVPISRPMTLDLNGARLITKTTLGPEDPDLAGSIIAYPSIFTHWDVDPVDWPHHRVVLSIGCSNVNVKSSQAGARIQGAARKVYYRGGNTLIPEAIPYESAFEMQHAIRVGYKPGGTAILVEDVDIDITNIALEFVCGDGLYVIRNTNRVTLHGQQAGAGVVDANTVMSGGIPYLGANGGLGATIDTAATPDVWVPTAQSYPGIHHTGRQGVATDFSNDNLTLRDFSMWRIGRSCIDIELGAIHAMNGFTVQRVEFGHWFLNHIINPYEGAIANCLIEDCVSYKQWDLGTAHGSMGGSPNRRVNWTIRGNVQHLRKNNTAGEILKLHAIDGLVIEDNYGEVETAGMGITDLADCTAVTISPAENVQFPQGSLQSAVTLTPADGEYISGSTQSNFLGDGFYTNNGFTRATAWTGPNPVGADFVGFDDPAFFPIGTWLTDFTGTGYYSRMDDLGLNGMAPCAGSVSLANNITFRKWAIVVGDERPGGTISTSDDPGVVGVLSADEPSTILQYETMVADNNTWLGSADGPGRFAYNAYFANVLHGDIGVHYFEDDMVLGRDDTFTNPPVSFGTWTSYDSYWFAGSTTGGVPSDLHSRMYISQPGDATAAQCARGSHYGSMVDLVRSHYPANDRRIHWPPVESGAPYTETFSLAITPAQLKWAVWATIVHGARLINYFVHTFRVGDALPTVNVYNDNGYGGPGIPGTGIYAATKEINWFVLELAPVINSPFDGYLCFGDGETSYESTGFLTACTSTNPRSFYSGVDASCKWQPTEGKHYILASTREQDGTTNWPVTFRMVDQGQTTATNLATDVPISVERGGGIPGGFCEFDDTFATAATYKAYRID